jgi:hypothetical protein
VLEVELDLLEADAGTHGVDRHPRLRTEPRSQWKHGGSGALVEKPLPGERLGRLDSCAESNQGPGNRLGGPYATAFAPGEACDPQAAGATRGERTNVAAQIGVDQEQGSRRGGALGGRERLAFAATGQAQHRRPDGLGPFSRPVAGAIVGNYYLDAWKLSL